jgi:hypothetical protein
MLNKLIFALVISASHFISNAETLDDLNTCSEQKVSTKRLVCFDTLVIKANKEFREKTVRDREESERKAIRDREEVEKQAKQREDEKVIGAARKMLSALQKLETRVQTGVSYRDYPVIVSDADYEVKQFSNEFGSRLPEVGLNATKVVSDYQYVLSVWRIKFNQTSPSGRRPNEWIHETAQIQAVLNAYPSTYSARLSDGTLHIDRVLSIIWTEASKKLKDVEQAISQATSGK